MTCYGQLRSFRSAPTPTFSTSAIKKADVPLTLVPQMAVKPLNGRTEVVGCIRDRQITSMASGAAVRCAGNESPVTTARENERGKKDPHSYCSHYFSPSCCQPRLRGTDSPIMTLPGSISALRPAARRGPARARPLAPAASSHPPAGPAQAMRYREPASRAPHLVAPPGQAPRKLLLV